MPKTLDELALSFQYGCGSSFDFFGLVRGEGRNGVGINGFSKNNRRKENLKQSFFSSGTLGKLFEFNKKNYLDGGFFRCLGGVASIAGILIDVSL